jgi:hypothetical protein
MRAKLPLLLLILGQVYSAQAQTYVSVGYGGVTCSTWATRKPIEGKAYEAWIYGYRSASNADVYKDSNVIDGVSPEQIRDWFDNFCHGTPNANLDSAVRVLIGEQLKKGAS